MATLTKQDWLHAGLHAMGESGIPGVRVELLAKVLGVTKGSFYHHFAKHQDLLDGMLERWKVVATEQVIVDINAASGTASQRLLDLALKVFSDEGEHDRIEWGIRQWAASSDKVATLVAAVDKRRIGYVSSLLEESGLPAPVSELRSHLMYRALIGEYIWRQHGGQALEEAALVDMVKLLLHQTSDQT